MRVAASSGALAGTGILDAPAATSRWYDRTVVSRTEPSRELPTKLRGARKRQCASTRSIAELEMAEANIRKRSDIADYFQVHAEPRVEEAHVDFGPVQDKPVTPFGRLPESEIDDNPAIRQILRPHQLVQHPNNKIGVQVLIAKITT